MSLPTLSQIHSWPSGHLEAAGAAWAATAQTWDESFTTVYRQAPAPGGTPWEGLAAEAAVQRVGADRLRVLGAVDRLHTAADVARDGVAQIVAARLQALQAVETARAAGYTVGEDLSVIDTSGGPATAARMAQARQLGAAIHARVAALLAVDHEVAGKIAAATSGLDAITFSEAPVALMNGAPVPTGPVVWCLLQGTGGSSWRCSVLYPGGGVGWYWSTTDDSGGYGP